MKLQNKSTRKIVTPAIAPEAHKTASLEPEVKIKAHRNGIATKKTGGQGKGLSEIPQKTGIQETAVGYKRPPAATQFKLGNNANPGGKPIGARNRLQGDFMRELSEDFAANGKGAIVQCRVEKPDVYIKVVASLMPKELEIKRPLEDLTDEELDAAVILLRKSLGTAAIH